MKKKITFIGLLTACFLFLLALPMTASAASKPSVLYRTHIQNVGWEKTSKTDGMTSGTSGRSLRLEAIAIKLKNAPYSGSIVYRTHIQNLGWEKTWKSDGKISGTSGKSLRLEAIQIKLQGTMASKYDVYYRVHAQNFGWLGWAKNGESAGSAGFSYRLEAIQIKLIPKGTSTAETRSTAVPFRQTAAGSLWIRGTGSKTFDVQGLGKQVPVSVKMNNGYATVLINNKTVLKSTARGSFVNTAFVRLANRKCFVFLELVGDEDLTTEACLYRFTGSKLVPEYNFLKDVAYPSPYGGSYKGGATFKSVSGNVMTFLSYGDSKAVGTTSSYIKLTYQGGAMVPQSRVVEVLDFQSKTDTTFYKLLVNVPYYAGSTSVSAAGTLKAGTDYRINAMYFKNGVQRYKLIGRNNCSYWISATLSYGKYGTVLQNRFHGQ